MTTLYNEPYTLLATNCMDRIQNMKLLKSLILFIVSVILSYIVVMARRRKNNTVYTYVVLLTLTLFLVFLLLFLRKRRSNYVKLFDKDILMSVSPPKHFDIHNYFGKCYAIVLPKRKKTFDRAMKSFGIKYEKIDPVMTSKLPAINELVEQGYLSEDFSTNKVAKQKLACHLSHLKAIRTFLSTDAKTCIIFEDDIQRCTNKEIFGRRMNILKQYMDTYMTNFTDDESTPNWDILYLGICGVKNAAEPSYYPKQNTALCRHAYALSRRGAGTILNNTLPQYTSGDIMYRNLPLQSYIMNPSIFYQNRQAIESTVSFDGLLSTGDVKMYSDFSMSPFHKVSVVMLHWKRGDNIKNIVSKYCKYNVVDEIIVWDSPGSDPIPLMQCDKLKIMSNGINNLMNRFVAATTAKNNFVLIQDDDILLPEKTVKRLANNLLSEPDRAHGLFGRDIQNSNGSLKYVGGNVYGEPDIILTPALMTRRGWSKKFLPWVEQFEDLFPNGCFNGEDILFSAFVTLQYGYKPKAHKYDFKNLDGGNKISDKPGHYEFRTKVVNAIHKKHPQIW
jgi:GR25 family glycosyltransferase involved in LPS biosynthesis